MLQKICDKCGAEEEIVEWNEKPIRYVRPSDKKTIDLCGDCADYLKSQQGKLRAKQLEESCDLNLEILG